MDENIKVGKNFSVDGTKLLKCTTNTGTVVIPDFITEIGEEAFFHLFIKDVVLPSTLKVIGPYAFAKMAFMNRISLPEGLEEISHEAFYSCAIYSVTLPSSVRRLGSGAFSGCFGLNTINLNKGLKTIGRRAFQHTSIKSLFIPASVEEIENGITAGCKELTHIEVDPNNKRYHSKGECIIETATNRLVAMCKASKIPDYVTTVSSEVLWGLGEVIFYPNFPNGVTTIEEDAFDLYRGKEIVIPGSVKLFGPQCLKSQRLVFANGIESLDLSLLGCGEVNLLHIPATVREIKVEGVDCTIGEITVDENSPYFHVEGGCLVENATNAVVWGRGDTVPEGATAIGLFCSTTGVLHVPPSVKTITKLQSVKELFLSENMRRLSISTKNRSKTGSVSDIYSQFDDVSELKKLHITASVTEIADDFFLENDLIEVTVDESNPRYKMVGKSIVDIVAKTVVYSKDDVLPEGIEHIGAGAFKGSGIKQLVLPPTIKSLGTKAFNKCTSLQSVQFSANVPQMGMYIFKGCYCLKQVVLPETIHQIPYGMFAYCSGMKTIDIPSSVLEIESEAFYNSGLTEVAIPNGVRAVKNDAFSDCKRLAAVNIAPSVREFGEGVFEFCPSLTEITIPHGVETIPEHMFWGCENLTKVVIPETVTRIEKRAFKECKNLNVQLPHCLKYLGDEAVCQTATEQLIIPSTIEVLEKGSLLISFSDTIKVSMKVVKYAYTGTAEMWDKIQKGFSACFKKPVFLKK